MPAASRGSHASWEFRRTTRSPGTFGRSTRLRASWSSTGPRTMAKSFDSRRAPRRRGGKWPPRPRPKASSCCRSPVSAAWAARHESSARNWLRDRRSAASFASWRRRDSANTTRAGNRRRLAPTNSAQRTLRENPRVCLVAAARRPIRISPELPAWQPPRDRLRALALVLAAVI